MSNQMFEKILNDTTNGSTDIFIQFLEFVRKINPSMDELLVYVEDLKRQYYEMLVIRNGADKLWNYCRKFKDARESALILQNEITAYNFQILNAVMKVNDSQMFCFYSLDGIQWNRVGDELDARHLSTKVAGGYVGTYLGLYAFAKNPAEAVFDWALYEHIKK